MKRIPAFIAVLILITVNLSCERDVERPRISIISHEENDQVWNTTVIRVEATDDIGVVRVEFFVNEALSSTLTSPPWEVLWDTRNYPDGPVSISVKAYDEVGNHSIEATMNLVIKNVLLTMTIEDGALWEDEDHIEILKCPVYLTDASGNLLDWALMRNGDTKVFMRPAGFSSEVFDLARGYFYHRTDDAQYFYGILYTYMDMMPGELVIEADEGGESVIGDYIGSCTFSSGDIETDDYYVLSYRGYNAYGNIHTDSVGVSIYENYRKAYFYLRQETGGYYTFYQNLEPDQHYLIYKDDLSSNMSLQYIDIPYGSFDYLNVYVDAYPTQGNYNSDYETLIFREIGIPSTQSSIRLHYPSGHSSIQDFYFRAYTYKDEEIHYYYGRFGYLPTSFKNTSADVYSMEMTLPGPILVSGNYHAKDVDIQHAYIYLEVDDNALRIQPRGPAGDTLRIPPLPSAIQSQYNVPAFSNTNLSYMYFTMEEHNDKNGYYPLVNHWSMMQSLDHYYAQGTEIKYIEYYKDYTSGKKTGKQVKDRPVSEYRDRNRNHDSTIDGPD